MADRANILPTLTGSIARTSAERFQVQGSTQLNIVSGCGVNYTLAIQVRKVESLSGTAEWRTIDTTDFTAGNHISTVNGNIGAYRVVLTPSASGESFADAHEVP